MAKASKEEITELEKIINDAASGLSKVTSKKMFGCHALFANDAVFGLVWKEGRIGVRLPDETMFDKLMASSGSVPWKAGPMVMSHWVLVPTGMHKGSEKAKLAKWLESAHRLALIAPKKPAPKAKKVTKAAKPAAKSKSIKPAANRKAK